MGIFGFVVMLLVFCAGLMAARFLMPHVIDQISIYACIILGSMAFCAAVIGAIKG